MQLEMPADDFTDGLGALPPILRPTFLKHKIIASTRTKANPKQRKKKLKFRMEKEKQQKIKRTK